jgi:hypothetical protein
LQRIRGLFVGILVGGGLALFVMVSLHATSLVALAAGGCVGLSVFAVVATRDDASDEAADAAWRAASLDLPPASDRALLERMQASMPGPGQKKRPRRPVQLGDAGPVPAAPSHAGVSRVAQPGGPAAAASVSPTTAMNPVPAETGAAPTAMPLSAAMAVNPAVSGDGTETT